MKPYFIKISIVLCTLFLWTGMSMATPTGIFVGNSYDLTVKKSFQDTEDNVNDLVGIYNDNSPDLPDDLTILGKWEVDKNSWDGDSLAGFTVSFGSETEESNKFGTWSANQTPFYYSLKAGHTNNGGGFELWYADGFLEGIWDTSGLADKNLSHISFWTAEGNTNPVPEPGTLALVGLGLAGIAGYRRKRHSS